MPAPHTSELVERARVLVTTTTRPLSDIALEIGVTDQSLRRWIKTYGWTRPPGAEAEALRKIPRARYPALRRLYENRGKVTDIAVVAGCSTTQINRIVAAEGWTPRRDNADERRAEREPSPALAEIQAALRDPALTRTDALRLIERAAALTASDALAGDPRAERTVQTLSHLAGLVKGLPETPAAAASGTIIHPGDAPDHFPDANDLIEEIARRFEAFSEEWMDPRILAAVAASVR